jgi:hypothetical protein
MATRFIFLLVACLLASLPGCSGPEEQSNSSVISSAKAAEPAQPLWPAPAPDAVADGNVQDYY